MAKCEHNASHYLPWGEKKVFRKECSSSSAWEKYPGSQFRVERLENPRVSPESLSFLIVGQESILRQECSQPRAETMRAFCGHPPFTNLVWNYHLYSWTLALSCRNPNLQCVSTINLLSHFPETLAKHRLDHWNGLMKHHIELFIVSAFYGSNSSGTTLSQHCCQNHLQHCKMMPTVTKHGTKAIDKFTHPTPNMIGQYYPEKPPSSRQG